MNFFLVLMLVMSLKVVLSDNAKNLFCFHTQYFLNFFNHNQRFLLEIEKNEDHITIDNLTNYGKALQTHGEVIMLFLGDFKNSYKNIFPCSLITVNMYLNNISDSLNMIAQNNDGEKNDAIKLLEGYKIIHFAIKEQLTNYIYGYCKNVQFDDNLVSCSPPIVNNNYTTVNLVNINNYIKYKIIMKFNYKIKSNIYKNYHPKTFLFYDIMTQQILYNKNNTIEIDDSQHIELNQLRFTPLNIRCTDGTRLTIQDVFQYMIYDFNSRDVQAYIKIILVATFRPVAIVIRNFLTLIQVASSENSDNVKFWLKYNFIEMGKKIMEYLLKFISLPMLMYNRTFLQDIVLNEFFIVLSNYAKIKKLSELDNKINKKLIKTLSNFFMKNSIYFPNDIELTNKNITESNADQIKIQLEQIIKKLDIYMKDLTKWKKHFNFIVNTFRMRTFNVPHLKKFIDFKILNRICNTEAHSEIYSFITKNTNKTDIDYYKDVEYVDDSITEFNLENLKLDQNENYINTNDFTVNQSTYNPHYMIDYLPYDV
ncbi:uncharacterized protein LOC126902288 [Daktulosphaira vitifoliae]|uniref:uncharacterized protein LOC126902288 n=1 Tax=Daktulosphaira vitifoliae TaxID=58002 RepID=UPI0021AA31AC|nr:uncharacterized protein LOC126902288 [Daktulosphaira vitifoliae]